MRSVVRGNAGEAGATALLGPRERLAHFEPDQAGADDGGPLDLAGLDRGADACDHVPGVLAEPHDHDSADLLGAVVGEVGAIAGLGELDRVVAALVTAVRDQAVAAGGRLL